MQKCVDIVKQIPKKKEEFFNKTKIKYEFLTINPHIRTKTKS